MIRSLGYCRRSQRRETRENFLGSGPVTAKTDYSELSVPLDGPRPAVTADGRRLIAILKKPLAVVASTRGSHTTTVSIKARCMGLAGTYGRYGYRRVTALLRAEGWRVNHKRVERIWRREGLKVPKRQPKRGRFWLTDGSCIRLRPFWRTPRLGLRLRRAPHARREATPHVDGDRRVHARVPGDRCRPATGGG